MRGVTAPRQPAGPAARAGRGSLPPRETPADPIRRGARAVTLPRASPLPGARRPLLAAEAAGAGNNAPAAARSPPASCPLRRLPATPRDPLHLQPTAGPLQRARPRASPGKATLRGPEAAADTRVCRRCLGRVRLPRRTATAFHPSEEAQSAETPSVRTSQPERVPLLPVIGDAPHGGLRLVMGRLRPLCFPGWAAQKQPGGDAHLQPKEHPESPTLALTFRPGRVVPSPKRHHPHASHLANRAPTKPDNSAGENTL